MKIHSETAVLERGGVEGEKTFRIQANARAFSILSSNLYRNKIRAVIRELSCNALDSHIAAGCGTVPFVVHLPNMMEPYLEIQDKGLGLTHDQVMNIYTTYFASTKNETNDLIGGLGLGGKSPFAYTNSFTVTAIHNGVSRGYAMVINETGEPAVIPMGESNTDQSNGVTIRIPVKAHDFDQFRVEAENVFRWFEHKPEVVGNSRYKIANLDKVAVFEGDRWFMLIRDYYNRTPGGAVMGNVLYPIQSENVSKRFYELLQGANVVLRFEIGELDIQPSREELSYDPVTVQVLEARLDQVLKDMRLKLEQHFVACNTLWEARCAARKLDQSSDTSTIVRLITRGGQPLTWRGQEIGSGSYMEWAYSKIFDEKNPAPDMYDVSHYARNKAVHKLDAVANITFVVGDCSDASARCRKAYYNGTSTTRQVYLIRGADAQVAKLVDWLGNPPTILASSLAKAERKSMKFKGRTWTGQYRSWGRSNKADNWNSEQDLTSDQGGYYVTLLHLDPVDDKDNAISLGAMVDAARKLGIIGPNTHVWGLNKTNSKLVRAEKNWCEFGTFFRAEVEKRLAASNVGSHVLTRIELNDLAQHLRGGADLWHKAFGGCDNAVGKLVRDWHTAILSIKDVDVEGLRAAARVLNINVEEKGQRPPLVNQWNACKARYPLLAYAGHTHTTTEIAEFIRYVNLVDNA
jgi:hypothetical protein